MKKPLLVGLNNPLSDDDRFALYPHPPGCAGARLLGFLRVVDPTFGKRDYLALFDRANVWKLPNVPRGRGAQSALRAAGRSLDVSGRRDVVLFGVTAWRAVLGERVVEHFKSAEVGGVRFWYMPHPSGRTRLYNIPAVRRRAARLLLKLAGRRA